MKMIYHQEVKLEPEETVAEKVRLSPRKIIITKQEHN